MRTRIPAMLAIVSIFGAAASLRGQAASDHKVPPPSIRTTGQATIKAKPDRAILDIGVVTQAATAEAAGAGNANQLAAVMGRLRGLGSALEMRTINYSLSPNYRYPKDSGQPTIAGYTASNTLQVTASDLSLVAKAIDLATQSGANKIERLQFTLKDESAVRSQALRQAAAQARSSADAIAAALGLKIVRVLRAEEGTPAVPRPQPMFAMAAERAAPTPVEPGNIEVQAIVTLTVQVE